MITSAGSVGGLRRAPHRADAQHGRAGDPVAADRRPEPGSGPGRAARRHRRLRCPRRRRGAGRRDGSRSAAGRGRDGRRREQGPRARRRRRDRHRSRRRRSRRRRGRRGHGAEAGDAGVGGGGEGGGGQEGGGRHGHGSDAGVRGEGPGLADGASRAPPGASSPGATGHGRLGLARVPGEAGGGRAVTVVAEGVASVRPGSCCSGGCGRCCHAVQCGSRGARFLSGGPSLGRGGGGSARGRDGAQRGMGARTVRGGAPPREPGRGNARVTPRVSGRGPTPTAPSSTPG